MPVVVDAWNALRRNPLLTLGYVACVLAIVGPIYLVSHMVQGAYPPDAAPSWLPLLSTAQDLVLVVGGSIVQTLFFSALGKQMDRPLWRCAGPQDALQRFFVIWLLVNLIAVLIVRMQIRAAVANLPEVVVFLMLVELFAYVLLPMIATSMMYQGRLVWSQLGESFAPFAQFPIIVLPVIAIHIFSFLLHAVISESLSGEEIPLAPLVQTLSIAPLAFLDILAFAAMWRVCMYQRDHGHNPDNDPYDF